MYVAPAGLYAEKTLCMFLFSAYRADRFVVL
ncbi:MAG: hypothetical protein ACI9VN_002413 [Patescibacteria group bacterium]|jgi:hypothetical protein